MGNNETLEYLFSTTNEDSTNVGFSIRASAGYSAFGFEALFSASQTNMQSTCHSTSLNYESSVGNTATRHISTEYLEKMSSMPVNVSKYTEATITQYIYLVCKIFIYETDYAIDSNVITEALDFMHPNGTMCTLTISDGEKQPLHNHLRLLLTLPSADRPQIILSDDGYVMKNLAGKKKICNNQLEVEFDEKPL